MVSLKKDFNEVSYEDDFVEIYDERAENEKPTAELYDEDYPWVW